MISTGHVLTFAAAALLIIPVPGPSVLFVIGRALAHGRRTALAGVLGNDFGTFVQAAAVALGIGTLLERSTTLFTIVKFAGAAYLIYLGVQTIRRRRVQIDLGSGDAPGGAWRAARDGFVVGVTNPKNVIFFTSALPQFVDQGRGHAPVQMLVFGLIFAIIAIVCDSLWSLLASGARTWFATSPRRLETVSGVGGVFMAGLGVFLAAAATST